MEEFYDERMGGRQCIIMEGVMNQSSKRRGMGGSFSGLVYLREIEDWPLSHLT